MNSFADELQRAENGILAAQLYVADCYRIGNGIAQNDVEAVHFYRMAAEQGNIRAQRILGLLYFKGRGVSQDDEEAIKWLNLAASTENDKAQFDLGCVYYHIYLRKEKEYLYFLDDFEIKKYRCKAYFWILQAKKNGNLQARQFLKKHYGNKTAYCDEESFNVYFRSSLQGNNDDHIRLGQCYMQENISKYLNDNRVIQDFTRAANLFKKAAQNGNLEAQVRLGKLYGLGKGVPRDLNKMFSLYQSAAEQNYAPAQYLLGECYREGNGIAHDDGEAFVWLERSAKNGYSQAQMALGNYYALKKREQNNESQATVEADTLRSAHWLRMALEPFLTNHQYVDKNAEIWGTNNHKMSKEATCALMNLGFYYLEGIGGPNDPQKASLCFNRAAQGNNKEAQNDWFLKYMDPNETEERIDWFYKYNLADPFYWGVLYYQRKNKNGSLKKAVRLFRLAAREGNSEAQLILGLLYGQGEGVKKSLREMINWLTKAAKQRNKDAAIILGKLFYQGDILLKDNAKAFQWMRLAAQMGDAFAQNFVGELLDHGDGVRQDYAQAVFWYQKAADQNYSEAFRNLSVCYALGRGVPKDPVKAAECLARF